MKLKRSLEEMGIPVSLDLCGKLILYMELLREANKSVNLTRDIDAPDAAERIILDSLAPLAFGGLIPQSAVAADIGSGAGLPGVPLAIARDDIDCRMVESIQKKCAFIRGAASRLELRCGIFNMRAEEYSAANRASADVCVCRAVSSLPTILEYASPMLKVGGKLIAYKAQTAEEEICASESALRKLCMRITSVLDISIPNTDWRHKLIVAEQVRECPQIYPRRAGLAERKPL
ncbi:MAG: 16S rRNA (guanine(527)-N(7))-methyltransferase RsmG [Oscillospiraceae bacterium]|jgi:16S rRNA (guanine527-N7)-methyltransferase|nr:16S rRNA (guanine(527)-N(7))-methyltransferase RsmG [Oscillospiraceae bacterium]